MLNDMHPAPQPADATPQTTTGRVRNGEPDEPLDPAIERVRVKLARLMVVGIGTLLVGVVAVFGAVIYRSMGDGSTGSVARGDIRLPLVSGARLDAASLAPNGLLLRIAMPDGSTQLLVLDPATGEPRLRVSVVD